MFLCRPYFAVHIDGSPDYRRGDLFIYSIFHKNQAASIDCFPNVETNYKSRKPRLLFQNYTKRVSLYQRLKLFLYKWQQYEPVFCKTPRSGLHFDNLD